MAYEYFNNNPADKIVGDCVVRAISIATNESWDKTYIALALQGFLSKDIMNSNAVWGAYLMQNGFERYTLPHTCPECYSFSDFAEDHPKGIYVLCTGTHVATVKDSVLMDAWDSRNEIVQFYWKK